MLSCCRVQLYHTAVWPSDVFPLKVWMAKDGNSQVVSPLCVLPTETPIVRMGVCFSRKLCSKRDRSLTFVDYVGQRLACSIELIDSRALTLSNWICMCVPCFADREYQ